MNYGIASRSMQYRKTELSFGRLLGKGSFSDIFEVTAAVVENDRSFRKVKDDLLKNTTDDLGRHIEAKITKGELLKDDYTRSITDDLDNKFNFVDLDEEDIDNDKYIDSLFSSGKTTSEDFMVPIRQGKSTKSVCFVLVGWMYMASSSTTDRHYYHYQAVSVVEVVLPNHLHLSLLLHLQEAMDHSPSIPSAYEV